MNIMLDLDTMGIEKFVAVTTEESSQMVYQLESVEVVGSGELKMYYTMKLARGIDYTEGGDGPLGWVPGSEFTEDVQEITFTVFPLTETVESQLTANGLLLLNQ